MSHFIYPREHQRHSFATRLLHSVLPASCYAPNDKSIDGLHTAIAEELTELFENGFTVRVARSIYIYSDPEPCKTPSPTS